MIPPNFVSLRKVYSIFAERYDSEAAGRLTYLLCGGNLQTFKFDGREGKQAISAEWWQNESDDTRQDIFTYGALPEIVVLEADLAAILPPEDNPDYADLGQAGPATRRGRPPAYDWEAIWAGLLLIVHDEGLPKTKEETMDKVAQWYEKSFGKDTAPDRSTLQPRITKLFALLAGRDPSAIFPSARKTKRRIRKKNR
jgi:hypothetical protein